MTVTTTRNPQAESEYRVFWAQWCLARERDTRLILVEIMDFKAREIATSPKDPRWIQFTNTLPGYKEYEARMRKQMKASKVTHLVQAMKDSAEE